MTAEEIIELLGLEPLKPEGGFYRETYRSEEKIPADALPERYATARVFSTAIYYLLTPESTSTLHRVASDEIFHFYLGDPVCMLQLHPDGRSEVITLGPAIERGEKLQVVVPRGSWQGSYLKEGGRFALLGTTVAPGFEFGDYEAGVLESLIEKYPEREDLIRRLGVLQP